MVLVLLLKIASYMRSIELSLKFVRTGSVFEESCGYSVSV